MMLCGAFRLATSSLLFLLASIANGSPTVTISSGVLVGTTTALPSATAAVNKFLGVPFAASPPERFSPPQTPESWSQPLNVTAVRPACIQEFVYPAASRNFTMQVFNNPGGTPPLESEDCLYLNVYAPAAPVPGQGRTVMFWIYGGGLQFGDAGLPTYDGSSLAAYQDVIVVAPNYRTNVFGFSNSPEIPLTSINAGFFDQRLALDWVQQNIAAFGGDPTKVTIFGESAGAASVDKLVLTMPNTTMFRAAILESGQASIGGEASAPTGGLDAWNTLVAQLHCSSATSALACVRSKPATEIKSIIEHAELSFPPVTDNITQRANPIAARESRQIANVPIFTGTNAQEGRVFEYGMTDLAAFLNATFPGLTSLQQEIIAAYPMGQNGLNTSYDVISQIATEFSFQCPAALVANISAQAGYPTWRYYFNASFPNTQAFAGGGVYHSTEIPMVFGTYAANGTTPQEYALSQYMQSAWANFAKDPARGPGWNQLGSFEGVDLGVLGTDGSSGVTVVGEQTVDYRCGLYTPLYEATST